MKTYLQFELLINVERVIESGLSMTLATFLSDSNFKFAKPLSQASKSTKQTQNNKVQHRVHILSIFISF